MEWTEEVILRLRTMWDEGLSTAEIGRRLCVSKNAVVGKAHRLGLAARPSPIRRDVPPRPRPLTARRIVGPTLPPLPAAPPAPAVAAIEAAPAVVVAEPAPRPAPPQPLARPVAAAAPRGGGRLQPCCWPLGDPGTRSFRFCDAESLAGKPYCDQHAQLAYVRVRDRRDEAA